MMTPLRGAFACLLGSLSCTSTRPAPPLLQIAQPPDEIVDCFSLLPPVDLDTLPFQATGDIARFGDIRVTATHLHRYLQIYGRALPEMTRQEIILLVAHDTWFRRHHATRLSRADVKRNAKRIASKFSTAAAFQAFLHELRVTPLGFSAALCRDLERERIRERHGKTHTPYPLAHLKLFEANVRVQHKPETPSDERRASKRSWTITWSATLPAQTDYTLNLSEGKTLQKRTDGPLFLPAHEELHLSIEDLSKPVWVEGMKLLLERSSRSAYVTYHGDAHTQGHRLRPYHRYAWWAPLGVLIYRDLRVFRERRNGRYVEHIEGERTKGSRPMEIWVVDPKEAWRSLRSLNGASDPPP